MLVVALQMQVMQLMILEKYVVLSVITRLDNFSEISARINDEGWESSISEYLKTSNLSKNDALFLSVGGGDIKKRLC